MQRKKHPEHLQNNTYFGDFSKYKEHRVRIKEIQDLIIKDGGPYLADKDNSSAVLPVYSGNEIVAFGLLIINQDHGDIMQMVSPQHKRKGIATSMLPQLENLARSLGLKEIHSFVSDKNKKFIDIMIDLGYKIGRREQGRILFVKNLN